MARQEVASLSSRANSEFAVSMIRSQPHRYGLLTTAQAGEGVAQLKWSHADCWKGDAQGFQESAGYLIFSRVIGEKLS